MISNDLEDIDILLKPTPSFKEILDALSHDYYYKNCTHFSETPRQFEKIKCGKEFCLNKQQTLAYALQHHRINNENLRDLFSFIQVEQQHQKFSETKSKFYAELVLKFARQLYMSKKTDLDAKLNYAQALRFAGYNLSSEMYLKTGFQLYNESICSDQMNKETAAFIKMEQAQIWYYLGDMNLYNKREYLDAASKYAIESININPTRFNREWSAYIERQLMEINTESFDTLYESDVLEDALDMKDFLNK